MSNKGLEPRERLIAALDFPGADSALAMADRLAGEVGLFKIGLELFTAEGPAFVRALAQRAPVFLDLKLHDIPNTVGRTAAVLARLGVAMINVHAAGGAAMIRAARDAIDATVPVDGERPLLLAVTVLTSLDEEDLHAAGVNRPPAEQAVALAKLAKENGCDGVVASAREARAVKDACGADFVTVTPGIRPQGDAASDQKRVVTPADAIAGGADYLVVGRSITGADDPAAAARAIVDEIAASA